MVQTTGNIHPGGDNGGWFSDANVLILSFVMNPEIPPTSSGIAILINNVFHLIFKGSPPPYRVFPNSIEYEKESHLYYRKSSFLYKQSIAKAPSGAVIRMESTATVSTISPQARPILSGIDPIAACTVAFGQ